MKITPFCIRLLSPLFFSLFFPLFITSVYKVRWIQNQMQINPFFPLHATKTLASRPDRHGGVFFVYRKQMRSIKRISEGLMVAKFLNRQNSLFSSPGPSSVIVSPGAGQSDRPSHSSAAAAPPSPSQMNKANGPIMQGHASMHGGWCGSFPAFLLKRWASARSARPLNFSESHGRWNLYGLWRVFATWPVSIQYIVFICIFIIFPN